MGTVTTQTIPEDAIRAIAYRMWEEEGRPEGRAETHWLKACEAVARELGAPTKPRRTAARPRNGHAKPKVF